MKEKLLFLAFFGFMVYGCDTQDEETGENPVDQITSNGNKENKGKKTKEELIRNIENQLKILPTEDYIINFYEESLDTDDEIDQVITVNLLNRAIKEAQAKNSVENRKKTGYVGNFNFFFFVDGKTGTITSPIAVPSSPHFKLLVSFDYLTSPTHKDIIVDFRIRRSQYRQYYTIKERAPFQVAESEVFENIGEDSLRVYSVQLEEMPNELWKSIAVYQASGSTKKIEQLEDSYSYTPEIKKSNTLIRRWYFSPQYLKYYLRKDEI